MGGVYTLVGLVDEWLVEENLSKDERLKEGQIIINNLCAYMRNPYKSGLYLYDKEYQEKILEDAKKDKSILAGTSKESYWQETSVRLAILEEIKKGFIRIEIKKLLGLNFTLIYPILNKPMISI